MEVTNYGKSKNVTQIVSKLTKLPTKIYLSDPIWIHLENKNENMTFKIIFVRRFCLMTASSCTACQFHLQKVQERKQSRLLTVNHLTKLCKHLSNSCYFLQLCLLLQMHLPFLVAHQLLEPLYRNVWELVACSLQLPKKHTEYICFL